MAHKVREIAKGVGHLPVSIANVYFVDAAPGKWVLVDAGTPGKSGMIRAAAESRYGRGAKPACIFLTHGHFDHAGSARELADSWGVPVYAHRLELPYLTGRSCYPPPDPTAPGMMSFLSRFFSSKPFDLGGLVRELSSEHALPGLEDWEWHHTPGHTPGHVSYFRPGDGTLLAGDAFTTVDLDSLFALVTKKQSISRPPTPMTCDWDAAAQSVRRLAALQPSRLACGHGTPILGDYSGQHVAEEFAEFARNFRAPSHGRYITQPARADETGVTYLPPKPADPALHVAAGLGVVAVAATVFTVAVKRRAVR